MLRGSFNTRHPRFSSVVSVAPCGNGEWVDAQAFWSVRFSFISRKTAASLWPATNLWLAKVAKYRHETLELVVTIPGY